MVGSNGRPRKALQTTKSGHTSTGAAAENLIKSPNADGCTQVTCYRAACQRRHQGGAVTGAASHAGRDHAGCMRARARSRLSAATGA